MKPALSWRALTCAAFSALASSAFAAPYSAIELPAKPAAKGGVHNDSRSAVLAADGRALIFASTYFADETFVGVAERCTAAGDVCKKGGTSDKGAAYAAASSDYKRFAGTHYDRSGSFSAIRLQKGVVETLVENGQATGINRKGVTVGLTNNAESSFIYDTQLHTLPGLAGGFTLAHAINDSRVAVGQSRLSLKEKRAVRWDAEQLSMVQTDIPVGLGFGSNATVITQAGTIFGSSSFHDKGTTQHAVRFTTDGKAVSLGALNANKGNTSEVLAANELGVAVGWSTNAPTNGTSQAALFKDGQVIELATVVPDAVRAKYELMFATAINDAGQILVIASRKSDFTGVTLRLDPQQ